MSRRPSPAAVLAGYRQHTRERYRQRWHKKLSPAGYAALCRAVADPDRGRFLEDAQGADRAVFAVLFRGDWLRVIVDLSLEAVVTVLPPTTFQAVSQVRGRPHGGPGSA